MLKLGILLSGRGSNFEAIADNIQKGKVQAEIAVVLSNVATAPGLEKARQRGFDARFVDPRNAPREAYDRTLIEILKSKAVDLVCLAGFMRILTPTFVQAFPNRILNIHPALLPSFPGLDAQRRALEHGVKIAGCTVHLVDEGVDSGPIVQQASVVVREDDTVEDLSERILREEHRIYSEAIQLFAENRVKVLGRRVVILPRLIR